MTAWQKPEPNRSRFFMTGSTPFFVGMVRTRVKFGFEHKLLRQVISEPRIRTDDITKLYKLFDSAHATIGI